MVWEFGMVSSSKYRVNRVNHGKAIRVSENKVYPSKGNLNMENDD